MNRQNHPPMGDTGVSKMHGAAARAPASDLKITPAQNHQPFVDISTPSPNSHNQQLGSRKGSQRKRVPAPPPPPMAGQLMSSFHGGSSFMKGSQFITMDASTTHLVEHGPSANCKSSRVNQRRRRPNVEAMLGSSMVRQSMVRASNMSSFTKSRFGQQLGGDIMSVPVLGDCNFEQKYSVAMSMNSQGINPIDSTYNPMAKLHALREVMTSIPSKNGYIERATFTQAFEVDGNDFDGYSTSTGAIDGNAILIDAVMELEVDAEEKLLFIFETLDPDNSGYVVEDQIVQLLESNFSAAQIDVVGTDFKSVVNLMFQKAQVQNEAMTYEQFKKVFTPYIIDSYNLHKAEPIHTAPIAPKSKFGAWYSAYKLRIWWLMVYIILNNVAFWLKWFSYEVDPAIGWGLRIARGNAQVIMVNCVFVLLPMCRSIAQVMKRSRILWRYIPFDDSIAFHKIAGSVLLTSGLIHTVAHIVNEINLYLVATPDEIRRSIFVTRHVSAFVNGERPPFTTMLQSLPVWTGFILLTITCISFPLAAIPKFRQGNFNVFWYSHMLFGPFLIVLSLHGTASWLARSSSYIWILPPFLIYLLERRYRYAKVFAAPVRIMEAMELDGVVALFMEKPRRFVYRPGMYMFVNCPVVSTHEWHPFTISSAPGDNYISVHIRACGDWTKALRKVISDCHERKVLYPDIYLDGPVGAPTQDYHRYKTVICVGGGIGVTPFASILKDVVHLWESNRCENCKHVRHPGSFKIQKLYFHWVTRGQESLGWFEETMNQIAEMDRDNVIETHQYLSTLKGSENTSQLKMFQEFVHEETGKDFVSGLSTKQLTHFGRPDWDKVFSEAKANHVGEEVGVFYCGPHALEEILGIILLLIVN
ncbi:ferric reductase [Plasmopara halstedii]|uniref:Ferric reductase n=1 Tax=Plasmopara halstedii TaxID=4781 RepID=A0A0P1AFF2_PLAHL|nr:ferric reductase [Plasmopara halstedii]CEG39457.1 ferric reductase [Plasmopara halstedii]|eukprot:XP_024575826.1 ferric reductase [Plasmopara halstedii]